MNSLRKNFIYNSIYQILSFIIPLFMMPYLSRVLGEDGIGLYSYSSSVAYNFVLFGLLGVEQYGNRTIAGARSSKQTLSTNFWNIYAVQLISSVLAIGAYWIFLLLDNQNKEVFYVQAIYVVAIVVNVNWFFWGTEEFKITVTRNLIIKFLTVGAIFLFVKSSQDAITYVFIMSLSLFISNASVIPFLRKKIVFVRPTFKEMQRHLKPNLVLFIPILATNIYKVIDKIMLGNMSNLAEVAFYENTEKLVQIPVALITALGTVMLPRISNLVSNNNFDESSRYMRQSVLFSVGMTCSIGFGLMGISDNFVPLFFGDAFLKCIPLIHVLVPSCFFVGISNVIRTQYLIPLKRDGIYVKGIVYGTIVNFILNLLWLPEWGAIGATFSTLIAEVIVFGYQCLKIRREIHVFSYIKESIPLILLGFVMYAAVRASRSVNPNQFISLLIQILIGVAVYISGTAIYYKAHFRKGKEKL